MIVCVCNAIRESELKATARDCPGTRACDVYARLGRRPRCGQCLPFAQDIIREARAAA